ncbi:MAG TPA: type II secretion system protein GspI [Gammaproteobacteria bacterium]|nr:MAG: type II secretion system protein GspI [OM182 bacterium]HAL41508.1 type II secretion system protein GspI [Gammaproteobacteria bacterium]HBK18347.1 type II secretion system protein GspI [Gammaproteobacteria bacterium]|tara:strand:+ start:5533 stop:5937 length:405 start_codon:yes stop_codon:yes gene_type:complete
MMARRKYQRARGGFTLIEMLIALTLIAIVGTTVATATGRVATQTYSLERKTVANWVASNHLSRMRLQQRQYPEVLNEGTSEVSVLMAQREWEVLTTISSTDHPWLRRIEIDVYEIQQDSRQGPIHHLTGFLGRY